ncbi:MAG TPA: HDOD domain-containing protein [Ideonella sp.]|nr:HDOD domain-containing protein [Ideonella sp.]
MMSTPAFVQPTPSSPSPALPASWLDDHCDPAVARAAWLFRHSLRAGEIHPAQHLIQRYRALEGVLHVPPPPRQGPACTAHAAIDAAALERGVGDLPALPQVVLELMALMQDEGLHSADFAARIECDQALVARTLRLANSPFYGVAGRVGTMRDAVQVLGMGVVSSLLTTVAVSGQFSGVACAGFDFPGFWKHALATGIAARTLARTLRMDTHLAFAAGLLHDIGRLVLAARFPAEQAAAIRCERDADRPVLDAEFDAMACDHTTVGTIVARHWHFPAAVVDAIQRHHLPAAAAAGSAPSLTDVVHVADALVHGLDLLHAPHESVPIVDITAWSRVALTPDQYMSILEQTEQGVEALCEALAL